MKIGMKFNKHCPRCNTKMPVAIMTCPNCQLRYERFERATNKEAKLAMKNGEKDQVIMRAGRPIDVKFWKLLLMAIFLGFAGGHHYYVGRYKKGLFYSIFFVIGVANAVISVLLKQSISGDIGQVFYFLVLIWGAVLAMWIIDIAKICFNKFKIPVSIIKD